MQSGLSQETTVAYHLHGQTGLRFTDGANGEQIAVLGNSIRDWRLPFAEIRIIYENICTTETANENKSFN